MSIERPIAAEQESGGEPRKTRIGVRVVTRSRRAHEPLCAREPALLKGAQVAPFLSSFRQSRSLRSLSFPLSRYSLCTVWSAGPPQPFSPVPLPPSLPFGHLAAASTRQPSRPYTRASFPTCTLLLSSRSPSSVPPPRSRPDATAGITIKSRRRFRRPGRRRAGPRQLPRPQRRKRLATSTSTPRRETRAALPRARFSGRRNRRRLLRLPRPALPPLLRRRRLRRSAGVLRDSRRTASTLGGFRTMVRFPFSLPIRLTRDLPRASSSADPCPASVRLLQARVAARLTPSIRSSPPSAQRPRLRDGTLRPRAVPSSTGLSSSGARTRSFLVASSSRRSCRPVAGGD